MGASPGQVGPGCTRVTEQALESQTVSTASPWPLRDMPALELQAWPPLGKHRLPGLRLAHSV